MAKKGKRKKHTQRETIPAVRSPEVERQSNVIQFPAAIAVASTQAVASAAVAAAPLPSPAPTGDDAETEERPRGSSAEAAGDGSRVASSAAREERRGHDGAEAGGKARAALSAGAKSAKKTTSSQMIRAIADDVPHAEEIKDFFKSPERESNPPPAEDEVAWEDLRVEVDPSVARTNRRLKLLTATIAGAFCVAIGVYVTYVYVLMPQPEATGGDVVRPTFPTPELIAGTAPAVAEAPAAVAPAVAEAPPPEPAAEVPPAPAAEAPAVAAAPEVVAPEAAAEEPAPAEAAPAAPPAAPAPAAAPAVAAAEPAAPAPAGDYAALLADARRARGRRAEELYRQALAVNPNGTEALADLGFALLNRGQNREAAELAERATALDPTSSKAWITLGAARQVLRDQSGATAAYQACVSEGQGQYVSDCRAMLR